MHGGDGGDGVNDEHHYYLTLGFEGLPGFLPGFLPLVVNLILFHTMLPSTPIIPNFVTRESFQIILKITIIPQKLQDGT